MSKPNVQSTRPATVRPTGIWCSPPRLQADTRVKSAVDRFLPSGGWRCAFFIAIAVGISAAGRIPTTPGLVLGTATTLVASSYCLLNFWRCREAHCIVSGIGWAALGLFEATEIALGHSLIHRNEGATFLAILVIAVAFEAFWRTRHGTNVLSFIDRATPTQSGPSNLDRPARDLRPGSGPWRAPHERHGRTGAVLGLLDLLTRGRAH